LVVLTAIESPDRALSIPTNGVFQNLVVVKRAVAESVVDSVSSKMRPPELAELLSPPRGFIPDPKLYEQPGRSFLSVFYGFRP
jgi:hypothetical protein